MKCWTQVPTKAPDGFSFVSSVRLNGRYDGNKILSKNLDLAQNLPKQILFHVLWVKISAKNYFKILKWPEMCPLGQILAEDFEMAAVPKMID